nr:site-specific integrase [Paeniclostridium sordellii]
MLNPYSEPTLLKAWYKFLENNNIKRITLHDLRHTHATLLILAGTDMKTVSDRLGHTDIKITMNRYSHVLEEMDRKASDNISNIMFK